MRVCAHGRTRGRMCASFVAKACGAQRSVDDARSLTPPNHAPTSAGLPPKRVQGKFEVHKKDEHNPWDYASFILYVSGIGRALRGNDSDRESPKMERAVWERACSGNGPKCESAKV